MRQVSCGQEASRHFSGTDVTPILFDGCVYLGCDVFLLAGLPASLILIWPDDSKKDPLHVNTQRHLALSVSDRAGRLGAVRDADLVLLTASHVSALIEDFDQKAPCLIYIEMIPLLVEKIRINRFPWDSRWKSFEAVQSRGVEKCLKNCP